MMLGTAVPITNSNATGRRLVAWLAGVLAALVLLVASMLVIALAAWPGAVTSLVGEAGTDLPLDQWLLRQAAAASGCGLDWSVLAGLEKEESDFGRDPRMFVPHDSGIVGLVQIQPGNWAIFAPPGGNPFDPHDALGAAAKFLCAHGAGQDIRRALFAYNHLDSYVADVLRWRGSTPRGSARPLELLPPPALVARLAAPARPSAWRSSGSPGPGWACPTCGADPVVPASTVRAW